MFATSALRAPDKLWLKIKYIFLIYSDDSKKLLHVYIKTTGTFCPHIYKRPTRKPDHINYMHRLEQQT